MKEKGPICNLDCFNCHYDDCIRPENQERVEINARYYEKHKEYFCNYYEQHKSEILIANKERYMNNRETKLLRSREYNKLHRAEINQKQRERRACQKAMKNC